MSPTLEDLIRRLQDLKEEFELDSVSGNKLLPDGHSLTLRLSGVILEIERDDGAIVLIDAPE